MNTEIRNPESTVAYLARSMIHWHPGKIHISNDEIVHSKDIGGYCFKCVSVGLGRLEIQIDKMMRNSPAK